MDPHAPSHLGLLVALTNSDSCDDGGHKEREENAAGNRKTLLAAWQFALAPMAQNLEEKERKNKRSPEKLLLNLAWAAFPMSLHEHPVHILGASVIMKWYGLHASLLTFFPV